MSLLLSSSTRSSVFLEASSIGVIPMPTSGLSSWFSGTSLVSFCARSRGRAGGRQIAHGLSDDRRNSAATGGGLDRCDGARPTTLGSRQAGLGSPTSSALLRRSTRTCPPQLEARLPRHQLGWVGLAAVALRDARGCRSFPGSMGEVVYRPVLNGLHGIYERAA